MIVKNKKFYSKIFTFHFLLFFLWGNISLGQHFEWAVTVSNLYLINKFASVDADQNIVVGGTAETVNMDLPNNSMKEARFYDSEGEPHAAEGVYSTAIYDVHVIVSYSSEGLINWQYMLSAGYTSLLGLAHDENSNTVLLLNVPEVSDYGGENKRSKIPRIDYRKNIAPGLYLFYLNKEGQYLKRKKIFLDQPTKHLTISQFQIHPMGGFVLTGYSTSGKLCNELDARVEKNHGNFIMVLEKDGTPLWANVVGYAPEGYTVSYIPNCKAAIAKDGTIYLGGTFQKMIIDKNPNTNGKGSSVLPYGEMYETYLAAYTPQGKLKWFQTSINSALFESITANQNGVFIGFLIHHNNEVFNQVVDTSGTQTMSLAHFKNNGTLEWIETTGTTRSFDMKVDDDNNLYVLGFSLSKPPGVKRAGVIGTDTLKQTFTLFIASFTEGGEYQWVKTSHLLLMQNEPHHLLMDDCNNMYATGNIWHPTKGSLTNFDAAFLKGEVKAAAPFIAKFNNTIPVEVAKKMKREEVCIISPGPWKIKNYPNPFETTTHFEYTLTYPDKVTLEIYDMKGELIYSAFRERPHEQGMHEFTFSDELPSGTYLAVLRGTGIVATCRIVVVRN